MTGVNTYTGETTVNAGNLIVDGSIASAQTFVNVSALLGGHGIIRGDLFNNGIVSQINFPGTLKVFGNYTQLGSGTLRLQVAGLAANLHDLLAVSGNATLAGTLQLVRGGGFNLHPGDQITFLTANKGLSGAFDKVQNDFATGTAANGSIITFATWSDAGRNARVFRRYSRSP